MSRTQNGSRSRPSMKRARSLGPTIQSKPDFCPTCDGRRIIKRGLRRNCFRQLQIYWCRDLRNRSEAFDTARSSQSLGQAEVPRAVLPEVKSEEDRSISRNLRTPDMPALNLPKII